MRVLARNMIFLMKNIELGKKEFSLPKQEEKEGKNERLYYNLHRKTF